MECTKWLACILRLPIDTRDHVLAAHGGLFIAVIEDFLRLLMLDGSLTCWFVVFSILLKSAFVESRVELLMVFLILRSSVVLGLHLLLLQAASQLLLLE
jgi:hypothetical protein